MRQAILQPADHEHYAATIKNPVSLSRMKPFLSDSDFTSLNELYPDGAAPTWGVTPAKNRSNEKLWRRMKAGNLVLFARGGKVLSAGEVTFKTHNRSLAEDLWKSTEEEESWEYVYFLRNVRPLDIPYGQLSAVIGYKQNFVVQRFNVLDPNKSAKVLAAIGLLPAEDRHPRPRKLVPYEDYNGQEVHNIFSPDTPFMLQRGAWGVHGIVPLTDRPGDFVFFVTLGQKQGEHTFEEGISEDGVLTWQSQPRQRLTHAQIQTLFRHDEDKNSIYLFFRTSEDMDYTYLGRLKYLSHDTERERPVYFRWQILDWDISGDTVERMGLRVGPRSEVDLGVAAEGELEPVA